MSPSPHHTEEFIPATVSELSRVVAEETTGRLRNLIPTGGRTALHYGYASPDESLTLCTSKLNRVIDYPARDMTVTVEAGMRLETLADLLKAEGQRLPIDVPIAHRATVGGILACNVSGARRYGYGTLRDYVIGVAAIDGRGTLFHAGGRVVKNVAGYDLCKLLIGSLGTLGMITQVTFKLHPIPVSSRWLWTSWPHYKAIDGVLERLLSSATRPVALEVLNPLAASEIQAESRVTLPQQGPLLGIAFEGGERETAWQLETLLKELQSSSPLKCVTLGETESQQVWEALTEFEIPSEEPVTFKANLRPSKTCAFLEKATEVGIELQAHAGNGIVIGHLPDDITSTEAAAKCLDPLRELARASNGNLVVLNCPDQWQIPLNIFGEVPPGEPLMNRVKEQLDPCNLWNRGRLIFSPGLTTV